MPKLSSLEKKHTYEPEPAPAPAPVDISDGASEITGLSVGLQQKRKAPVIKTYDSTESRFSEKERRLRRRAKLLSRGGYDDNMVHLLDAKENRRGSEMLHLGVVSGTIYNSIAAIRTFDEFCFLLPTDTGEQGSITDAARALLRNLPTAQAIPGGNNRKAEHKFKGPLEHHPTGFKPPTHGPPGLAPPIQNIPNSEGRDVFFRYEGPWKDGRMSGSGVYTFADGLTYEGVMRDDLPNGPGVARYVCGTEYQGEWQDGKHNGPGTATYVDGSSYTGMWKHGKRHGDGTLVLLNGTTYSGDFYGGVPHGWGKYYSPTTGVTYRGRWENGFVCGYGTLERKLAKECEALGMSNIQELRQWPERNRYGGIGLSIRGAVELMEEEIEWQYLYKLQDREGILGRASSLQITHYVNEVREQILQRRLMEKTALRDQKRAARKEQQLKIMQMRMDAAVANFDDGADEEEEEMNQMGET